MIIDAMDILYSGKVDGFCLVSSDSDFTRLAARLQESGMTVIGMGESKTPNSFIAACNKFKYLDILSAAEEEEPEETPPPAGARQESGPQKKAPRRRRPRRKRPRRSPSLKRSRRPSPSASSRRRLRSPAPACAPSAGPADHRSGEL